MPPEFWAEREDKQALWDGPQANTESQPIEETVPRSSVTLLFRKRLFHFVSPAAQDRDELEDVLAQR